MNFGEWLIERMHNRDMNQSDLARAVGRSTATVSRWANNLDTPSDSNLRAIARAIGATDAEISNAAGVNLIASSPSPRSVEDIIAELEAQAPIAIPVVQNITASAGPGEHVSEYIYLPPTLRRGKNKNNILGIVASGQCMEPQIMRGDYVIFDRDAAPKVGNIVVASVDGEVYVKRLVEVGGKKVLRGDADGCVVSLNGEAEVIGVVMYIHRPLFQ